MSLNYPPTLHHQGSSSNLDSVSRLIDSVFCLFENYIGHSRQYGMCGEECHSSDMRQLTAGFAQILENPRMTQQIFKTLYYRSCTLNNYSMVLFCYFVHLGVIQVLRNARGGGWVYAQALRSVTRGWGGVRQRYVTSFF